MIEYTSIPILLRYIVTQFENEPIDDTIFCHSIKYMVITYDRITSLHSD